MSQQDPLSRLFFDWFLPNMEFSMVWAVIVALIMSVGISTLLGPVTKLIADRKRLLLGGTTVFVATFLLAIALRSPPQVAKPELFGVLIYGFLGGEINRPISDNAYPFGVLMSISNRGDKRSVAIDYKAELKVNDHTFYGRVIAISGPISFDGPPGLRYQYSADDALYKKTSTPIEPGDTKTGILLFVAEDVNKQMISAPNLQISVYYKDIMGQQYKVVNTPSSEAPAPEYIPGVNQQIIKK